MGYRQEKILDRKRAQLMVKELFMDMKVDLKAQKDVGMAFHVFFEDGYWRFQPEHLSKAQAYSLLNLYLTDSSCKAIACSVTSDCNMLCPSTHEIIGEQLMAAFVTPDCKVDVIMQPYTRLPNGKIKYERAISADENTFAGDITSLYQLGADVPDEMRRALVEAVNGQVARGKQPYKSYSRDDEGPAAH